MIMAQVRLKMQFEVRTEWENRDEPLLVMAGELLLQAMQFAATVHLEPRNRDQFMNAAEGYENNRRMLEDQQVEGPVTETGWRVNTLYPPQASQGAQRIAVVAVWQD